MTGERPNKRRLLALAVGAALSLILLAAVEALFFALNRFADDGITVDEPYLYAFSKSLGYKPLADAEGRAIKTHGGDTLFDVVYRTDAFGRRMTPPPECAEPPREFMAFFGGSFTFGHGLDDNETLPAQVQARLPGVRAYNYGFSGYGPQQALVKVRSGELQTELAEPNGTMVYVFMGHHVRRAIGSMRVWTQWGRHFPYFALDGDGALVHRGSFVNGRPVRSRIYDLLRHEQLMSYFDIDLPVRVTKADLALTAEILRATQGAFLEAYPDGRFLVLIYPASPSVHLDRAAFRSILRNRNVDVLDASNRLDMTDSRYHIPHDGHPTAAAHAIVADALAAYLR